ncbi:Mut7-C RNAse domain-containing protein [Salinigranum salinum]|uniref:Mut7-C RNAse domain-containing protein n=1 Tax=Salinigranum salinum TaxID=1364937 RepID=UPI001260FFB2|nr:Mut7-C RNAse domain-containing protein [Salinigranum salinum]
MADPSDRLLLDAMLGKLARYLRMCGYDAAYALDRGIEADDDLRAVAESEGRALLTRDRQLAARVPGSVRIDAREIDDQLRELRSAGFELSLAGTPARCGRCNGPVDAIDEHGDVPDYAPDPGDTACYRCRDCGQVFWKGSHWDDVRERIAGL